MKYWRNRKFHKGAWHRFWVLPRRTVKWCEIFITIIYLFFKEFYIGMEIFESIFENSYLEYQSSKMLETVSTTTKIAWGSPGRLALDSFPPFCILWKVWTNRRWWTVRGLFLVLFLTPDLGSVWQGSVSLCNEGERLCQVSVPWLGRYHRPASKQTPQLHGVSSVWQGQARQRKGECFGSCS